MAKWKEIPTNKKAIPTKGWSMTAEEMDALLDDVFYKVCGFVPVAKYEEDE